MYLKQGRNGRGEKISFSLQKTFNKLMYIAVVCTLPVKFLKLLKNVTGSF